MSTVIAAILLHGKYLAADCQTATGFPCATGLPKVKADGSTLPSILTFVFAIIAALAVLMIVIAGMRYVTSGGNPQETGKAKNTIIYAVVGLLFALAAQSIVRLVINRL